MSSTYRLLCLSHDPAIIISDELSRDEIEKFRGREHEAFAGHPDCDVIAGAFSYPFVEAGCFGAQVPGHTGCRRLHSDLTWADANLLRLLRSADGHVDEKVLRPFITAGCWSLERLSRLRVVLGES